MTLFEHIWKPGTQVSFLLKAPYYKKKYFTGGTFKHVEPLNTTFSTFKDFSALLNNGVCTLVWRTVVTLLTLFSII